MLENGGLTDEELQKAVGDVLQFPKRDVLNAKGKKIRLELHEMSIPRRRAIIVTNSSVLKWCNGEAVSESEESEVRM